MEKQIMQQEITNAEVRKDIEFIKDNLKEINSKLDQKYVSQEEFSPIKAIVNHLDDKYVTHEEFKPVQKIAYGLAGGILIAVLGAIVTLVFK